MPETSTPPVPLWIRSLPRLALGLTLAWCFALLFGLATLVHHVASPSSHPLSVAGKARKDVPAAKPEAVRRA